jgi:hypothetical protein
MKKGRLRHYGVVLFAIALAFGVFAAPAALAAKPTKITICHAAGLADEPANWVTLSLPPNAVYGQNGASAHFNEQGTPLAGHEQDYLGPCEGDEEPPPDTFALCHDNGDGTFTLVEGTEEELADHAAHETDVDPDEAGACPVEETEEPPPPEVGGTPPEDDVLGERIDRPAAPQPEVAGERQGAALPFTGLDPMPFLALSSLLAASGATALTISKRK